MMHSDYTGVRIGMLTVIRICGSDPAKGRLWLCLCDCGQTVARPTRHLGIALKKGALSSCGCALSSIRSRGGAKGRTHGLSQHLLYDVWRQMHRRCYNEQCKDYAAYGARGISVCDAWHDLTTFIEWGEASGHTQGLTLERSDNDGNYDPANCSWIPNRCQALNTRRLTSITYGPITAHASFWARKTGLSVRTILSRRRYGWSDREIIETPVGGCR